MVVTSRLTIVLGLDRWISWSIVVASRSRVSSISRSSEEVSLVLLTWSLPALVVARSGRWYGVWRRLSTRDATGRRGARVGAEGQLEAVRPHQRVVGERVVRGAVGRAGAPGQPHRPRAELQGVGQGVGHHQHGDVE